MLGGFSWTVRFGKGISGGLARNALAANKQSFCLAHFIGDGGELSMKVRASAGGHIDGIRSRRIAMLYSTRLSLGE